MFERGVSTSVGIIVLIGVLALGVLFVGGFDVDLGLSGPQQVDPDSQDGQGRGALIERIGGRGDGAEDATGVDEEVENICQPYWDNDWCDEGQPVHPECNGLSCIDCSKHLRNRIGLCQMEDPENPGVIIPLDVPNPNPETCNMQTQDWSGELGIAGDEAPWCNERINAWYSLICQGINGEDEDFYECFLRDEACDFNGFGGRLTIDVCEEEYLSVCQCDEGILVKENGECVGLGTNCQQLGQTEPLPMTDDACGVFMPQFEQLAPNGEFEPHWGCPSPDETCTEEGQCDEKRIRHFAPELNPGGVGTPTSSCCRIKSEKQCGCQGGSIIIPS